MDTIVNAGDSVREGEIIVRTCVEKTNVKTQEKSDIVIENINQHPENK